MAGIDTKNGRIAVKGWKAQVALTPDDAIPQLEPYAAAFLYTHVDGEGLMQGFPIETAARLRKLTAAAAHRGRRHSQPAGSGRAGCLGSRCRGGHGGLHGTARGLNRKPKRIAKARTCIGYSEKISFPTHYERKRNHGNQTKRDTAGKAAG